MSGRFTITGADVADLPWVAECLATTISLQHENVLFFEGSPVTRRVIINKTKAGHYTAKVQRDAAQPSAEGGGHG